MPQKTAPKISKADEYLLQLQNAERALKVRNEVIIMLEGDVARLGGTKRDWSKKARELEKVLEEAGSEVGGLQSRLLALDEALKGKDVEAAEREARVREFYQAEVDRLNEEVRGLHLQLDQLNHNLGEKNATVEALHCRLVQYEELEQKLRRQVAKLEAKGLKYYVAENAKLHRRLHEKSQELEALQAKVPTRIPLPVRQVG